ncbi:MAG: lysozyme inhibitor LprI family protein [Hyphomicrobiales bacterium]
MPRIPSAILLLACAFGFAAGPASPASVKPSFDCRKAKTDIEKQICGVAEYAALDRDIAAMFAKALKMLSAVDVPKLKADQVKWLGDRNDCIDLIHGENPVVFADVDACLGDQLRKRAKELKAILDGGKLPEATLPQ